jgi:gluconokinase
VSIRVVIVMGVTGSGKSTVARALADRLGWRFCDADDLHSPENIERMRRGIPLDDERRAPWLLRIREAIDSARARGQRIVVACSALKERYRVVLTGGMNDARYVHLTAPDHVLRDRLRQRPDHFAGVTLLDSQLAALEPPLDGMTLDATAPVPRLVDLIADDLSRRTRNSE